MGQPAAEPSAAIPLSTVGRGPHPELETETPSHHCDKALEAVTEEQHSEDLPKPKKPRAFYLAFTGIAVTVFLFHLDATALGIALPVSLFPCFDKTTPNIKADNADSD